MQRVMKSEQAAVRMWIRKRVQRQRRLNVKVWAGGKAGPGDWWYWGGTGNWSKTEQSKMTADFWFRPGQLWEGSNHDHNHVTWPKDGWRKEVPLGKILLAIICGPSKPTMLFFLLPKGSNDEQGATYNWSGERSKQRYLPCEITSSWQDKKDLWRASFFLINFYWSIVG